MDGTKIFQKKFVGYDCTNLNDKKVIDKFRHNKLTYDQCKNASIGWDNTGKHYMIESVYWEWVMCQFKDQFAEYYGYKINSKAIDEWDNLKSSEVLNSLLRQMNDFHSPAFFWRTKKKIVFFFASKIY